MREDQVSTSIDQTADQKISQAYPDANSTVTRSRHEALNNAQNTADADLSPSASNSLNSSATSITKHHLVSYAKALAIHQEAVLRANRYKKSEGDLLEIIIEAEAYRIYEQFDLTSLYQYCVDLLGLSEHSANNFISVARTSIEVPQVLEAIYSGQTTVSKIRKVSSVITKENAKGWIDLAIHCSARVVEKAVALKNPRAAVHESLKYISSDVLQLNLTVSEQWAELLTATKDRLSQKEKRSISTEEALFILMRDAHEKHDPVERAKRAKAKSEKLKAKTLKDVAVSSKITTTESEQSNELQEATSQARSENTPSFMTMHDQFVEARVIEQTQNSRRTRHRPSQVTHEVNLRDEGQCTHILPNGLRCQNKRWVEQHHVFEFAKGGEHTAGNLVTLCSSHHRMRHMH